MADRTTLEIADGIAWVTLDDGKVNAMSTEMMSEIEVALDEAEAAGAVTVLAGRAGIFSAGFDMGTLGSGLDAARAMVLQGARLIERLLSFPQPVVTACTGHAYPMGAFLMLAADSRFGVYGEFRIGMNETAIGLTIPLFAIELARHRLSPAGLARVTTAAMFDPEEALRLGYLDRVVEADRLRAEVEEEAERLLALDRPSVTATKARVNAPALAAIRSAIEAELAA
ncbi:MAG: crotonase/enoyl-CoA hydratase family protein [Deltaproteobacteria bacterium]|nr:crotonase/enoyl-CoA hydratase family protein [Deltaproteobacteria bacterium]